MISHSFFTVYAENWVYHCLRLTENALEVLPAPALQRNWNKTVSRTFLWGLGKKRIYFLECNSFLRSACFFTVPPCNMKYCNHFSLVDMVQMSSIHVISTCDLSAVQYINCFAMSVIHYITCYKVYCSKYFIVQWWYIESWCTNMSKLDKR